MLLFLNISAIGTVTLAQIAKPPTPTTTIGIVSKPPITSVLGQKVNFKDVQERLVSTKEVCQIDARIVGKNLKPSINDWEYNGRIFATMNGKNLVEIDDACKIIKKYEGPKDYNALLGPIGINGKALWRDATIFSIDGTSKTVEQPDVLKGRYNRPFFLSGDANQLFWTANDSHSYAVQDISTKAIRYLPMNIDLQKIFGFSPKDDLLVYTDNDLLKFARNSNLQILKTGISLKYAGTSGHFVFETQAPYRWVGTAMPLMHENYELYIDTGTSTTQYMLGERADIKAISASTDWRYLALAINTGKLVAYRSIKSEYFIYVLDTLLNKIVYKKSLGVTNFDNQELNLTVFLKSRRFAYNLINVGGERDFPKSEKLVIEEVGEIK